MDINTPHHLIYQQLDCQDVLN